MSRCVPNGLASSSSDIRKVEDMDEISQAVEVDRGGEGAGISVVASRSIHRHEISPISRKSIKKTQSVAEIRSIFISLGGGGGKRKSENVHVQNTQHCNQNRSWHQKLQKFRANPDDSCGEKVPNYDSD